MKENIKNIEKGKSQGKGVKNYEDKLYKNKRI